MLKINEIVRLYGHITSLRLPSFRIELKSRGHHAGIKRVSITHFFSHIRYTHIGLLD